MLSSFQKKMKRQIKKMRMYQDVFILMSPFWLVCLSMTTERKYTRGCL